MEVRKNIWMYIILTKNYDKEEMMIKQKEVKEEEATAVINVNETTI